MLLIVISPEKNLPNEQNILIELFTKGLTHFHLRKPDASKTALENYINAIPVKYHKNIVLHSHYDLALQYNLKGIHLTEKSKQQPHLSTILRQLNKSNVSASFHSIKSLQLHRRRYNYVFLSPLFDSISKHNYVANFNEKELQLFLNKFRKQKNYSSVIALGGVTINNIERIKNMGFGGAAVLGSIWQNKQPVAVFNMLQSLLSG